MIQRGHAARINVPTTEAVRQLTDGIKRPVFVMLSAAKHLSLITLLRPFGRLRLTRRGRAAHINVPTTETVKQPTIAAGCLPCQMSLRLIN